MTGTLTATLHAAIAAREVERAALARAEVAALARCLHLPAPPTVAEIEVWMAALKAKHGAVEMDWAGDYGC
jgi:hypothetical protein